MEEEELDADDEDPLEADPDPEDPVEASELPEDAEEALPELDSSVLLSASVDSWLDSLAALELSSAFEDSSAALELSSGLDDSSSLELSSLASAFGNAESIASLISAGVYPACQREVLSSISEILGLEKRISEAALAADIGLEEESSGAAGINVFCVESSMDRVEAGELVDVFPHLISKRIQIIITTKARMNNDLYFFFMMISVR